METQGFTFRVKGCAPKMFTDAQAQDAIDNVAQKLAYVMGPWMGESRRRNQGRRGRARRHAC